ncbi:MAG: DNA polymerase III subunit epsilon [Gluconacetobacter diazotrophicus]|nr:DNA polymerase III subunit epsilon [Gluconacetobacter diazotrophicus]
MDDAVPFVRVIDLETTGSGFADGGVVEIGWQDVALGEDGWALRGGADAVLIDPGRPISAATSAIHHIVDEDVRGASSWLDAAPAILRAAPGPRPAALAAHRAAFEQRWCGPALQRGVDWICTYKCALRIWPDAPGHSNQGLRYWRRPDGLDRATGLPAHRAGPDAYVTAFHLRDMLAVADLDTLLLWSREPALLVKVPFGRWRGRRIRELDDAALEEIALAEPAERDLGFSVRREQEERRRSRRAATGDAAAGEQQAELFR